MTTRDLNLPAWSLGFALLGACILAAAPARWVWQTWFAPESGGFGVVVFAWMGVLILVSLCSGAPDPRRRIPHRGHLLGLMALTAMLRLLSQWLDVSIIGALLLAVDVYVLARVLRLDARPRALSAFWLGVLFCFCLPVEMLLQRVTGFPLQLAAAHIAYGLLLPFVPDLAVNGVRLLINGADVLVDLPCSGSTLLSVLGVVCISLHVLVRPSIGRAVTNLIGFVAVTLLANGARVALLALGIGYRGVLGFDVMQTIPHALIGVFISLGAAAVLLRLVGWRANGISPAPVDLPLHASALKASAGTRSLPLPVTCTFVVFALAVGALQPQPVDASPSLNLPQVPTAAAGFFVEEHALSPAEEKYFAIYGGAARRASYGPFGLLVVTTQSPLRHLHDPAVCFRGMGYEVTLVGSDFTRRRTVYRVREPKSGDSYALYVSYAGATGTAVSIAQVVWRWLRDISTGAPSRWTMVQRIVPAAMEGSSLAGQFDASVRRAFEL